MGPRGAPRPRRNGHPRTCPLKRLIWVPPLACPCIGLYRFHRTNLPRDVTEISPLGGFMGPRGAPRPRRNGHSRACPLKILIWVPPLACPCIGLYGFHRANLPRDETGFSPLGVWKAENPSCDGFAHRALNVASWDIFRHNGIRIVVHENDVSI